MTNTTQAPRPAAVDLSDARDTADTLRTAGHDALASQLDALVADLAYTRAERDAALADVATALRLDDRRLEQCRLYRERAERAEAAAAPAPTAPDVPPFLAHRVNG